MAGLRIEGNTSGNVAEVDASGQLKVVMAQGSSNPADVGSIRVFYERDPGTYTGAPDLRSPKVSMEDRLGVGVDQPAFEYFFTPASQDTAKWYHAFTTMTMTQSGGFLLTNANSTATTTTGCLLLSKQYISTTASGAVSLDFSTVITALPLANQNLILGMGYNLTATAQPADGVWFKLTSAGLIGQASYNGTTNQTGVLLTLAQINNFLGIGKRFRIFFNRNYADFWMDGDKLGRLVMPSGQGLHFMQTDHPIIIQQFNSGAVSGSPQMQAKISSVCADYLDMNWARPYNHLMPLMGQMSSQGQGGGTQGTTALFSNSLAAGAGTAMTNTTAALGTGLGGQFSALPTLAAGTDGILCSYLVPAGGVNQPPMSLVITGVRVQGAVTTVLAGGPVLYAYSLAYGHTALSLATAESASFATGSAKAPRRVPLGFETFAATAAVGVTGAGVYMPFNSPIVVNPGEYVAVVAKNLGTVTTAGVITTLVTFDGYWV